VAARATWAVYREAERIGRLQSAWYLANNLARGALKRVGMLTGPELTRG
jgi:hypothetical protein